MNILDKFIQLDLIGAETRIGVIGDAMVDEYFNVKVKKISPEFPIPVMHSDTDDSQDFPGGAANVAYQFKNFNTKVNLISFLDKPADSSFSLKGINTAMCVRIDSKIPRKRRFYSDDFPTYRWDVEQPNYGLGHDLNRKCFDLYEKIWCAVDYFDVLIFSDYDKGVFSKYLDLLIPESPISIVDSKSCDLDRWHGCTVFKPNKQEALACSGCSNINDAGKWLLDKLKCKAVVITQAGEGVTVFDEGIYEIRPTTPLPPAESVIGAGDCFTAFLAMALGRGMSIRNAAEIAWCAGTLYVKNRHNKPLNRLDLINTFDPTIGKIISGMPENVFSNRKYKLVFTNGCFDILHAGHLETLKFAKSLGDKLVVAVNTDESVSKLKPGRPYVSLNHRMRLLAALEFVDFVIPFGESTPLDIIKRIKPDVLVKGGDYQVDNIVGYGIVPEIVVSPMVQGLSTTNLVEKIKAQDNPKPL